MTDRNFSGNVRVLAMAKGRLSDIEAYPEVKIVRDKFHPGDETKVKTQIECGLEFKENSQSNMQTYAVVVPECVPAGTDLYFELQLAERGEKNLGYVITNRDGGKLDPRYIVTRTLKGKRVNAGMALFRTTKRELLEVMVTAVRNVGVVVAYRFDREGRQALLVTEIVAECSLFIEKDNRAKFSVKELARSRDDKTTSGRVSVSGDDIEQIRWTSDSFGWLANEVESRRNETIGRFEDAVEAAYEKALCNCYHKQCDPHYALTPEEAKKFWREVYAAKRAQEAEKKGKGSRKHNPHSSTSVPVAVSEKVG